MNNKEKKLEQMKRNEDDTHNGSMFMIMRGSNGQIPLLVGRTIVKAHTTCFRSTGIRAIRLLPQQYQFCYRSVLCHPSGSSTQCVIFDPRLYRTPPLSLGGLPTMTALPNAGEAFEVCSSCLSPRHIQNAAPLFFCFACHKLNWSESCTVKAWSTRRPAFFLG